MDRTDDTPVYVIGAGPAGLATAAALRARGVRAVVLERSGAVGSSWRGHYDRLHLHTPRALSGLPGLAIPRRFGRWVSRDNMVRYLEKYAAYHDLDIVTGVEVTRIEKAEKAEKAENAEAAGDGWLLHATGGRRLAARTVVVATGYSHTPRIPDWPGLDGYTGKLLHAREYREPSPYRDLDVLVVGVGNTGAEIAVDLARGGAARVRLAVRTPPHILRRSTLGWPSQRTGILVRRLPVPLVDRAAALLTRVAVPDLAPYGLPRPETGLYTRVRQGASPVQDMGLIAAVRSGAVRPVAAVTAFDGESVVLADGGSVAPDVVIAATGYRRGLEGMLGHLEVLDPGGRPLARGGRSPKGAPGLHFTGYTNPISGMLREIALDADRIAREVARARRRSG
ncbi:flavin-containing monooxygenase [Streptomyces yaizuensis]|uniref:NAD(P)/FAD-dependent oxidoreductase n=1 Tax=Streptomyces yaizuensis TaxID=2989713 RepID=A0ABQ5P409_9ACTN|nr:NAD(P)/FAD-dependent oxidoreductase [Streptomyces sp. YSPA8]GLF97319.1 NAD(P)/FAD-dependent oxidoreductase [Streptomyces sp. YSPA8]